MSGRAQEVVSPPKNTEIRPFWPKFALFNRKLSIGKAKVLFAQRSGCVYNETMDRRLLQKKLLNIVKKSKLLRNITETAFHDINFNIGKASYSIVIPKDRKESVKLYRIEKGHFYGDKETLEIYQQINAINGDLGNVYVFLNDFRDIIFAVPLRTDNRTRFVKSLFKGILELKHKVAFYEGGYIDELVEELPCISCRYHLLDDNKSTSRCELGESTAFYMVKSNECPHQRGWSEKE
jgi:hypothetical protein